MKLNVTLPISQLSLGQVSLNFLKEFHKKNIDCSIFPIGNVDLNPFSVSSEFKNWLESSIKNRYSKLDKNAPTFRCWHLNGSESRLSEKQVLYTFHETDTLTNEEIALAKHQTKVIFSSEYSDNIAKINGVPNSSYVPLGLDDEFVKIPDLGVQQTHWVLIGKAEHRKCTQRIVNIWSKIYGNNRNHLLTLLIHNPFFSEEHNNAIVGGCFENGKKPYNVMVLKPLATNKEVNMLINSADIDLSGLSMGEGWGLPSFNATALGKWSIVNNATAHKSWANEKNCVLINPNSKIPCYDGVFFVEGREFNQGNFWNYSNESLVEAMKKAEKLAKTPNLEGEKLATEFTYSKSVDKILEQISS